MSKQPATPAGDVVGRAAPSNHVAVVEYALREATSLLDILETNAGGLDAEQIDARLHRDGLNQVSHEKPPHWTLQLLRAFRNPFIVVLLVLAGVQLFSDRGDLTGPTIIAVMVGISVILSFTQQPLFCRSYQRTVSPCWLAGLRARILFLKI